MGANVSVYVFVFLHIVTFICTNVMDSQRGYECKSSIKGSIHGIVA